MSTGCTTNAMDLAACNGFFNIVKFLHQNRNEGCTIYGINTTAILCDNTHILFLYKNYKHLITRNMLYERTYKRLLPFIIDDFVKLFCKIEKQNIVRNFIAKTIVYHPMSAYMKRIISTFDIE